MMQIKAGERTMNGRGEMVAVTHTAKTWLYLIKIYIYYNSYTNNKRNIKHSGTLLIIYVVAYRGNSIQLLL